MTSTTTGLFSDCLPAVDVAGGLVVVPTRTDYLSRFSQPALSGEGEGMDIAFMAVARHQSPGLDAQQQNPGFVVGDEYPQQAGRLSQALVSRRLESVQMRSPTWESESRSP